MTGVNKSLNYCITILIVIALIGILLIPAVSAGKFNYYGPNQWMNITIPAMNYIPSSSSSIPSPHDPGFKEPVCTPVKIDLTNNASDYPLFLRAQSVGDIYYLVIQVNSKIKSKAESYFIQVTRAEYCAENPTSILLGGWIYPDNSSKVSVLDGVTSSLEIWPPYGYESTATIEPPYGMFPISKDPVIRLNNPISSPSQNIINLPQTSVKSSKNLIPSNPFNNTQFQTNINWVNPLGQRKDIWSRTICSVCS
jgi:hypothetical protein